MNFETLSDKQLGLIEQLASELLEALRRGKFSEEVVYIALMQLEEEASKERRQRYDQADQQYSGY